jgi:hypothetical protein
MLQAVAWLFALAKALKVVSWTFRVDWPLMRLGVLFSFALEQLHPLRAAVERYMLLPVMQLLKVEQYRSQAVREACRVLL